METRRQTEAIERAARLTGVSAAEVRAAMVKRKTRKQPMGDVAMGMRGADAVAAGNEDAPAKRSRAKDLEKVMYRLRPDQIRALRVEASRRADKIGSGRPDASEVLREVLDGELDPAAVFKRS